MSAQKKTLSKSKADFKPVFAALEKILKPYSDRLAAKGDAAKNYHLESREPTYKNRPMYFAGVRANKSYVSFYLMSVYTCPELLKRMSPALKKRMQGKACFNFSAVDENCFKELAALTEAGYRKFKKLKYL